jgi:hypothetical protein
MGAPHPFASIRHRILRHLKRDLGFFLATLNFNCEIKASQRFRAFKPEILASLNLQRVAADQCRLESGVCALLGLFQTLQSGRCAPFAERGGPKWQDYSLGPRNDYRGEL